MSRSIVSYKDITKAIENLIKKKGKITINNIKEIIGKGSITTISKMFKMEDQLL